MPEASGSVFAMQEKSSHQLIPGVGYIRHFKPPVEVPDPPLRQAEECEPPSGTPSDTMHTLVTPHGEPMQNMRWHLETKEWAPLVPMAGNRLAFTSRYLAALGWKYGFSQ